MDKSSQGTGRSERSMNVIFGTTTPFVTAAISTRRAVLTTAVASVGNMMPSTVHAPVDSPYSEGDRIAGLERIFFLLGSIGGILSLFIVSACLVFRLMRKNKRGRRRRCAPKPGTPETESIMMADLAKTPPVQDPPAINEEEVENEYRESHIYNEIHHLEGSKRRAAHSKSGCARQSSIPSAAYENHFRDKAEKACNTEDPGGDFARQRATAGDRRQSRHHSTAYEYDFQDKAEDASRSNIEYRVGETGHQQFTSGEDTRPPGVSSAAYENDFYKSGQDCSAQYAGGDSGRQYTTAEDNGGYVLPDNTNALGSSLLQAKLEDSYLTHPIYQGEENAYDDC